jgi:hypothetical protein
MTTQTRNIPLNKLAPWEGNVRKTAGADMVRAAYFGFGASFAGVCNALPAASSNSAPDLSK